MYLFGFEQVALVLVLSSRAKKQNGEKKIPMPRHTHTDELESNNMLTKPLLPTSNRHRYPLSMLISIDCIPT